MTVSITWFHGKSKLTSATEQENQLPYLPSSSTRTEQMAPRLFCTRRSLGLRGHGFFPTSLVAFVVSSGG